MSREINYNYNFLSPEMPSIRPITPNYSIVRSDVNEYIIDQNSRRVSNFYHQIGLYSFEDSQYVANFILGRSGAIYRPLSFNNIDKNRPWFLEIGDGFHFIEIRPDLNHQIVGTLGACEYILDKEFRKNHKGYHSLRWDCDSDTYYGTLNDKEEMIRFIQQT